MGMIEIPDWMDQHAYAEEYRRQMERFLETQGPRPPRSNQVCRQAPVKPKPNKLLLLVDA